MMLRKDGRVGQWGKEKCLIFAGGAFKAPGKQEHAVAPIKVQTDCPAIILLIIEEDHINPDIRRSRDPLLRTLVSHVPSHT
jgi:hypothetical protein